MTWFCVAQYRCFRGIITSAIHTPNNGFLFLPLLNATTTVHEGFICDSCHRCTVVRILQCEVKPDFQFKVEIFPSETGEWTESVVPCPPGLRYDEVRHSVDFFLLNAVVIKTLLIYLALCMVNRYIDHSGFLCYV